MNPTEVTEITKAITYLKAHPDDAQKMGKNSRRAVEQEFNGSKQEEKFVELYTVLQ